MTTYRIELNLAGISSMFQEPGVKSLLNEAAATIARSANKDYGHNGFQARPARDTAHGAIALVVAESSSAKRSEAVNKTLSKAVANCRL